MANLSPPVTGNQGRRMSSDTNGRLSGLFDDGIKGKLSPKARLLLYRKQVGITADDVNGRWPFEENDQELVLTAGTGTSTTTDPGSSMATETKIFVNASSNPKPTGRKWIQQLRMYTMPSSNRGCYHDTLVRHWWCTWYYYISVTFIYTALLSQVVFGATITAIQHTPSNATATTVLGTFVTVLGAILAWMKGYGIPKRAEQYRKALANVKFYIEFMDSQFQCIPIAEDLDPHVVGGLIITMYQAVKDDYESNRPDVYDPSAATSVAAKWKSSIDAASASDSHAASVRQHTAADQSPTASSSANNGAHTATNNGVQTATTNQSDADAINQQHTAEHNNVRATIQLRNSMNTMMRLTPYPVLR